MRSRSGPRLRPAHPGTKNVYASKKSVAGRYPVGTLIVKEGFTTVGGKRFVSLIATMRKQRGLDPAHGNWKFIEWTRSSPNTCFAEIARDATCWGCHAGEVDRLGLHDAVAATLLGRRGSRRSR